MEIDYITGPKTAKISGITKYQMEIQNRLNNIEFNCIEYNHSNFRLNGINIGEIVNLCLLYPLIVANKSKKNRVKHITSQNLAYLLKWLKLKNTIVTCHDLIPWVYEKKHAAFWKYNIAGMKKADRIITVSEYSKSEIIKYLNYPEENIDIVYPAVNHENYQKRRKEELLINPNIPNNYKIILYVGSEQPRQNVPNIIKAISKLKKKYPNIKFVKIGRPDFIGAREENLNLIKHLKLEKNVIFVDYVPEKELPQWYNFADLFIYPCSYAGFGLPPLESMACGTPVITSNTTSLPEVVGDAGIMVDPDNIEELAIKMYNVLTNDSLAKGMAKKGLKRSKMFNWNESAKKTEQIYENMH